MFWNVTFYKEENEAEPVKSFILNQPDGAIGEILHVFKLLREFNLDLKHPYTRKVEDDIRELRIKHSSDYYRIPHSMSKCNR